MKRSDVLSANTQGTAMDVLRAPFAKHALGLPLALLALILGFGSASEYFLTRDTFIAIANEIPALLVMAVGMTFVLIIAGIDLSVGSVLAISGAVSAMAMQSWHLSVPAAMALGLLCGVGCGALNGLISVTWRMPSFIVTLGMLEVARGGAYLVTDSRTQYIGSAVDALSAPLWFGISPAFLLAVLIVIVGHVVLRRSVFGRYLVGVGTNEEAMRLAGVDPRPLKVIVFVLMGALAALAGLMQISRLEAADPNAGIGMELQVIAAVVIGGTSLMGGRGSVLSTFFGVLIVAVLEAGLAQVGASDPTKRVITGCVIIIAVLLDVFRNRKRRG
jgi:ribose transport system permease protein